MRFLTGHLWPALAAASVLGLAFGIFGTGATAMSRSGRARLAVAACALFAAMSAAALEVVPGAAGLWLDGLVLIALAYLAGCATGLVPASLIRKRGEPPPEPAGKP